MNALNPASILSIPEDTVLDEDIQAIMQAPDVSDWLKEALASSLERDPVDAFNDVERLRHILERRVGCSFYRGFQLNPLYPHGSRTVSKMDC